MKYLLIIISLCSFDLASSQTNIGVFENSNIINTLNKNNTTLYNEQSQIYTLQNTNKEQLKKNKFKYFYNKISNDFILTANFKFIGNNVKTDEKVGWMIRESEDKSIYARASLYENGITAFQWKKIKDEFNERTKNHIQSLKENYEILQLERKGNIIIFRAAHFGEPLQIITSQTIENLPDSILAGLFITTNNPNVVTKAEVWNVRIDYPVKDGYNPNEEGYLGCRLEILDPFNGKRKVIFEKSDRFEAPNWMPDGKKLLFNMEGSLYKIPIKGGKLEKLNTDFANQNNNDHGISFDGKILAISHHREGFPGGGSTVYTLPIEGGVPKLVTVDTPSYWHGWAPNNKEVVYVAQRNKKDIYNIYKASIKDGKETQLTNFISGHVDGPEYSPDGKYIYYNGTESGTMQLWRMSPNGLNREQITFDKWNNWFPHISPNGKWILYLSFPEDIPVNSHPSYKRVILRIMSIKSGESKVVAYLYGGQGTINVPSWSPDSKYVAFVSNSGK